MHVAIRFALSHFAPTLFALSHFALTRFALSHFALTRFALSHFALTRFALSRFALSRFALSHVTIQRPMRTVAYYVSHSERAWVSFYTRASPLPFILHSAVVP